MATIVDLNLGDGTGSVTQSYDLVLTSPYTEPSPYLLVLRSRPDIDPVTGSLSVTGQADVSAISGNRSVPADPVTATFLVTEAPDTAQITGTRSITFTGDIAATSSADTASLSGDGYIGLGVRRATLTAISEPDTAAITATWTMKWRGSLAVTGQDDSAATTGGFVAYQGPGQLILTNRPDKAVITGTNIYDVTGTVEAVESHDTALFSVSTNTQLYPDPLVESIQVFDVLVGEAKSSLATRITFSDMLDYSRDIAFTDTVSVADSLSSKLKISQQTTEVATFFDTLSVVYQARHTDAVKVTDSLTSEWPTQIVEDPVFSDVLTSRSTLFSRLTDTATFSDAVATGAIGETLEIVAFADLLVGEFRQPAALVETIRVSDTLLAEMVMSLPSLADTAIFSDEVVSNVLAESEDTLIFTDNLTETGLSQVAVLADTVLFTDILIGDSIVYAPMLSDTVRVTDTLTSETVLVAAGVLSDTVLFGDTLSEAAQIVQVVNAETGAVSTYVFTPTITGITDYQGVLYLAGPNGLYALDATTDDDGSVVWTLRTGFNNLGIDKLKRVRDVNLQVRTEGDTTFQVISDRYGQKQEWNYRLPPRTRDSYRDGVVKIGRGIQSVYWQFAAQGVGPTEIDQMRLVVELLGRRR